jgi:hypothetical protein
MPLVRLTKQYWVQRCKMNWPISVVIDVDTDLEIHDSMLRNALGDAVLGEHSGWHTENLIKNAGFSREERDQWAAITTTFRRGITSGMFRRGNCQSLKEKSGDIRFDKDEPHGGIHPWRR